jgi:hypothetical protein
LRRGRKRVTAVTFTHVHRYVDVPRCALPWFIICAAQAYGNVVPTGRTMCTCTRFTTALIYPTSGRHIAWNSRVCVRLKCRSLRELRHMSIDGCNPPANPSRLAHTLVLLHLQTPVYPPPLGTTNQSTLFT